MVRVSSHSLTYKKPFRQGHLRHVRLGCQGVLAKSLKEQNERSTPQRCLLRVVPMAETIRSDGRNDVFRYLVTPLKCHSFPSKMPFLSLERAIGTTGKHYYCRKCRFSVSKKISIDNLNIWYCAVRYAQLQKSCNNFLKSCNNNFKSYNNFFMI